MRIWVTNDRTIVFLAAVLLAIPTFGISLIAYFVGTHLLERRAAGRR